MSNQQEQEFNNLIKALPVLLIATIVLVISLFFVSPFSKRKLFAVQGAVGTTQETLIEKSGIKATDYISQVYLNLDKHENAIVKNEPWVKSAQFNYEFPNRFYLTVEEHEIIAYHKTTEGWRPVLSSGDFLDIVSDSELPATYLAIDLADEKEVSSLVTKLATLDEEVLQSISIVQSANSTSTKDLLLLTMTQGHQVKVPLSEVDVKLPYYKTIKNKLMDLRLIDMEVGIYTTMLEAKTEPVSEEVAVEQVDQAVADMTIEQPVETPVNNEFQQALEQVQEVPIEPVVEQTEVE